MVALARALMARPKLLLLDEPSTGLAHKVKQQIFEVIQEIKRDGVTDLLVEQDACRRCGSPTGSMSSSTGAYMAERLSRA
jgi:branched-chain amino acid transport system ATP-binding protein